jgi:hypothetical protein
MTRSPTVEVGAEWQAALEAAQSVAAVHKEDSERLAHPNLLVRLGASRPDGGTMIIRSLMRQTRG